MRGVCTIADDCSISVCHCVLLRSMLLSPDARALSIGLSIKHRLHAGSNTFEHLRRINDALRSVSSPLCTLTTYCVCIGMPQPSVRQQLSLVSSKFSNLLERASSPTRKPALEWQGQQAAVVQQEEGSTDLSFEGALAVEDEVDPHDEYDFSEQQEASIDPVELARQLWEVKQQYQLKQQEVKVLQAQVQRLANYVDTSVSCSGDGAGKEVHNVDSSSLRMQLEAAAQELVQTKTQLQGAVEAAQQARGLLASTAASKSSLEKRTPVLKMLLAEHIRDNVSLIKGLELCQNSLEVAHVQLQDAQRQRTEMEADLVSKERERAALQDFLDAAKHQIAQLLEEQHYLQEIQQPLPAVVLSRKGSTLCQQCTALQVENAELKERVNKQHQDLDKQKQELETQKQELTATEEQQQALSRLLAIKEDNLAYAGRHSAIVEQQLESVKQQLSEVQLGQRRTAEATTAASPQHLPSTGAAPIRADHQAAQQDLQEPLPPQQQQQSDLPDNGINITRTGSTGFLDGLAAALSNRFGSDIREGTGSPVPGSTGGANADTPGSGSTTGSPTRNNEQAGALGPFALARNLMAQREENIVGRLKEELRDREKQVKELTTALSKAESQLHGLQTVLQAKTGAYNRLDSEMSKLERQLKHVQAAATADADGYRQQLGILSERVLQLEGQVSAGQQREQQLQVDLVTVRTKLGEVLTALVQETDFVQKHKPQQHAQLRNDAAAVLAEVDPKATSVTAAAQHAIAGSSAAALAVLGTAACGSANASQESLSIKLMGVLLGRRSSTGVGDWASTPAERELSRIGSKCGRSSNEWPGTLLTPTAKARIGAVISPSAAGQGSLSSKVSGTGLAEALTPEDSMNVLNNQPEASANSDGAVNPSAQELPHEVSDSITIGVGKPVAPDPVQEKLSEVRDLLHKLGSLGDVQ